MGSIHGQPIIISSLPFAYIFFHLSKKRKKKKNEVETGKKAKILHSSNLNLHFYRHLTPTLSSGRWNFLACRLLRSATIPYFKFKAFIFPLLSHDSPNPLVRLPSPTTTVACDPSARAPSGY